MTNWFRRWVAFFRPMPGWKGRFLEFKKGRTGWSVPGRPECHQVAPWPIEWIPHRLLSAGDPVDEEHPLRGFQFLIATCAETGKLADVGVGVRCCRCGIDLHPIAAHQFSAFEPGRCSRCKWVMGFLR